MAESITDRAWARILEAHPGILSAACEGVVYKLSADSIKEFREPPQDAWDVLDAALADQRQVVAYALGKVDEVAQQRGNYPHAVTLPYWTSQAAYDAGHVPEDGGDWRMANANSRLVAFALHERGIPVEWIGTWDNGLTT